MVSPTARNAGSAVRFRLARLFFLFTGTAISASGRLRVNNRNRDFTRRRVAAVTEEGAGSVQKTVGDHAACFHCRRCGSVDVLIEVRGAPDDDHPDRQHESDCKSCEHLQFPPCRNLPFTAWHILRQAGRANHPNRTYPTRTSAAMSTRRGGSS